MAAARKIKTLLTVNILVFVGIVLFSVYCRIQDRSEEFVQLGRSAEVRARTRHGKVTDTDRQSILQRLERLEDVVYNQLNGMRVHSYHITNKQRHTVLVCSALFCLFWKTSLMGHQSITHLQ